MKSSYLIYLSLFLGTVLSSGNYSIESFEGPPFSVKPYSGVYELGGLGFGNITEGATVVAYGDFNNDKFTDIATLSDDGLKLTINVYSHLTYSFSELAIIISNNVINSVMTGDFDYNGKLDLLLVTAASSGDSVNFEYFFQSGGSPYFGNSAGQANIVHPVSQVTQPFIFDAQGDRNMDVMYFVDNNRFIQTIVKGAIQETNFAQYISKSSVCKDYSLVSSNNFATPHSNAFVDFNGDCASDLFITSIDPDTNALIFEFWLLNPEDKLFCLVDVKTIEDPNISVASIGDMNNDGRLDLVFAAMPDDLTQPMSINILYNTFTSNPKKPCTLTNTSMVNPYADDAFNTNKTIPGINQVITLGQQYSNGTRLYSPDPVNRPSKIRIGDINIDGYSDLLFVVQDPVSNFTSGSIVLGINQQTIIGFDASTAASEDVPFYTVVRTATLISQDGRLLSSIEANYASFFDFDEIGRLGIWVTINDKNDTMNNLVGLFNFVNSENFILKTLGLNGVNPGADEDEINLSLGGIYYGASLECEITATNGTSFIAKGAQMPQSAYMPLDLPYIFIGIGRTNNYIENLVMGVVKSEGPSDFQQQSWTPIIPNSQLIINPLVNNTWTMDVYVNPTSETILIGIITTILLVFLGGFITFLHLKEKEEDKNGRDKYINIFG